MNESLHLLWVWHIVKGFYAIFSTRLNNDVAGVNKALENTLMEVNEVDFV
jgi:hypothetical protein